MPLLSFFTFFPPPNPLGNEVAQPYSDRGNLLARRDARNAETLFTYDSRDWLVGETDALGGTVVYTHDDTGNVVSSTDRRGNAVERQFDEARRVTKMVLPPNAQGARAEVGYQYNTRGQIMRTVDSLGNETLMTYDPYGRLVATTDALGNSVTNTYDSAGRLVETRDARGSSTSFVLDALDRTVRTVDALDHASETSFDDAGRRVATRDAAGNETTFVFDSRDRVVAVHGPDGSVTTLEHDAAGRRTAMVDPAGRRTEFDLDALGRVVTQRRFLDGAPLETTFAFDGNGNRTSVTDEAGRTTLYEFDELNRLVATIDAAGGVTSRLYDADSNLVRYVNARGSAWSFDYDALSRVVAERDPLGHETLFRYDLGGRLVWKRDAKGQETTLAYDALGRLVRVDYADGEWATMAYDENGNRTLLEGSGGVRVAQTFDELDRVATITQAALERQLAYEYAPTGQRSALEVRDGATGLVRRTEYSWDAAGRVAGILPWTGDAVAYRYNPDGSRQGVTLPNGLDLTYSYDSLGRLTDMVYRNAASQQVAFFRYSYDSSGNRTSMVDTEGLTSYLYDSLDRLVEADYPDARFEKFSYDAVGNRLTHEDENGVTGYSYDIGDRLLATTGAKPAAYTWDPNGNMLTRVDQSGTTGYSWTARDRLARVNLPDGGFTSYSYLPESDLRWVSTDATGLTTRWLCDGPNVIEELDGTNAGLAAYIEGVGIDEHLARVVGGATFAYVADPLGTVRALVGADGLTRNTYAYRAFGETRAVAEGVAQPYRFTGREFEAGSGEYYFRARYYQPGVGRFGAVDPYAPGEATYLAVGANPVRLVDLDGRRLGLRFENVDAPDQARVREAVQRSLLDLTGVAFRIDEQGEVSVTSERLPRALPRSGRMIQDMWLSRLREIIDDPRDPDFFGNHRIAVVGEGTPSSTVKSWSAHFSCGPFYDKSGSDEFRRMVILPSEMVLSGGDRVNGHWQSLTEILAHELHHAWNSWMRGRTPVDESDPLKDILHNEAKRETDAFRRSVTEGRSTWGDLYYKVFGGQ